MYINALVLVFLLGHCDLCLYVATTALKYETATSFEN